MKNVLTTLGMVIVAAIVGAVVALQPWSSTSEQVSLETPDQLGSQVAELTPEPVIETPVESVSTSDTAPDGESEQSNLDSKRLSLAVDILKSLNVRMTSLEDQVKVIEQDLEGNRLTAAQNTAPEPEPEEERIDGEQPTATELSRAQARETYFQDIEQSISGGFDEQFSQEITDSYSSFLASGESWTKGVSVNSTECGGSYCKVVVNYPSDMDPEAQFELDGRLYMQVSSQLPQSKSIERNTPDGNKEILIYFAKKDAEFPIFPE